MTVALIGEKIVGFLQLLQSEDLLTIDLIAVDSHHLGNGIAGDLIRFSETHCQGCKTIQVGTQIANTPSIRFYEGMGFRLISSQYIFHFHN